MKLSDFVIRLLPRFERSTVEEDLRIVAKEFKTVTMPAWEQAADIFKVAKYHDPAVRNMDITYYRYFNPIYGSRRGNFVLDIASRLKWIDESLTMLQDTVTKSLDRDLLKQGMTVKHASLVRSCAIISNITRYMLSLLNYIYAKEAEATGNASDMITLTVADRELVEKRFEAFASIFNVHAMPAKDYRNFLGQAPNIMATEGIKDNIKAFFSGGKDVFEVPGTSAFINNPIYAILLPIAQWQTNRYERAKDMKRQLELRSEYLKMLQKKKYDPAIEKEIELTQTRIEKYEKYMRDVEEDLEA